MVGRVALRGQGGVWGVGERWNEAGNESSKSSAPLRARADRVGDIDAGKGDFFSTIREEGHSESRGCRRVSLKE